MTYLVYLMDDSGYCKHLGESRVECIEHVYLQWSEYPAESLIVKPLACL